MPSHLLAIAIPYHPAPTHINDCMLQLGGLDWYSRNGLSLDYLNDEQLKQIYSFTHLLIQVLDDMAMSLIQRICKQFSLPIIIMLCYNEWWIINRAIIKLALLPHSSSGLTTLAKLHFQYTNAVHPDAFGTVCRSWSYSYSFWVASVPPPSGNRSSHRSPA